MPAYFTFYIDMLYPYILYSFYTKKAHTIFSVHLNMHKNRVNRHSDY